MDVTPLVSKGRQLIESYGDGAFKISGVVYTAPVIVFPESCFSPDYFEADESNFRLLREVFQTSYSPSVLLFGTGKNTSLIPEIEKAILSSDLGLNPSTSGDLIRVTMPVLTEETRQDYIKQARAEAENSRVSIRNIRRDANQVAKDKQQSSEISEDDLRRIEDLIQKETDKFISIVDSDLKNKESDLLEI